MTRAAAPRPRVPSPRRRSAPHATLSRAPEGDRPAERALGVRVVVTIQCPPVEDRPPGIMYVCVHTTSGRPIASIHMPIRFCSSWSIVPAVKARYESEQEKWGRP